MSAFNAINAYTKVGLESNVTGSDPHKLIQLLFQATLVSIESAKSAMQRGDIASKGESISKAIMFIGSGLQSSLNREVGGELANNLFDLYSYMITRLTEANLKNDVRMLDEVHGLAASLKDAWESIKQPATPTSADIPPPANKVATLYGRA